MVGRALPFGRFGTPEEVAEITAATDAIRRARAAVKQPPRSTVVTVLERELPLDAVLICPHDSGDGCECRKPKPGLLVFGAQQFDLALSACYMIGDRWRDMDAAAAAGVAGVWIDYGYAERGPTEPPAARVKNLREAVDWIVNQESHT